MDLEWYNRCYNVIAVNCSQFVEGHEHQELPSRPTPFQFESTPGTVSMRTICSAESLLSGTVVQQASMIIHMSRVMRACTRGVHCGLFPCSISCRTCQCERAL